MRLALWIGENEIAGRRAQIKSTWVSTGEWWGSSGEVRLFVVRLGHSVPFTRQGATARYTCYLRIAVDGHGSEGTPIGHLRGEPEAPPHIQRRVTKYRYSKSSRSSHPILLTNEQFDPENGDSLARWGYFGATSTTRACQLKTYRTRRQFAEETEAVPSVLEGQTDGCRAVLHRHRMFRCHMHVDLIVSPLRVVTAKCGTRRCSRLGKRV